MKTLLDLLNSLESYSPAFKDSRNGVRRIKCFDQLTQSDYKTITDAIEKYRLGKYIVSMTNVHEWIENQGTDRERCSLVFVIRLKETPSKIILE